jgi:hypothetical protein
VPRMGHLACIDPLEGKWLRGEHADVQGGFWARLLRLRELGSRDLAPYRARFSGQSMVGQGKGLRVGAGAPEVFLREGAFSVTLVIEHYVALVIGWVYSFGQKRGNPLGGVLHLITCLN